MCIAPKYKLSKEEAKRFRQLSCKEAVGIITPKELAELNKLSAERNRRFWAQPKMQALKRREKYLLKRTAMLLKQAKALERKISRKHC